MELLATAGSEAGSGIAQLGWQLALLGGVALFFGSLRLVLARPTRPRIVLAAGLFVFAAGFSVQNLERLEVIVVEYYPGWKADRDRIFLEEDPDLEFSDDDLETELRPPFWWEGLAWWGQRAALLAGTGLAAVGFHLDGRWLPQGSPGERRGKPKARTKTKGKSKSKTKKARR